MRYSIFLLLVLFLNCSAPSPKTEESGTYDQENPNQALYDQVMEIHDEAMPRLGEIERIKRELSEEIANSPDLVIEKKSELERTIKNLDSASQYMMDWMHEFKPLPDSTDREAAREYLESEMENHGNGHH